MAADGAAGCRLARAGARPGGRRPACRVDVSSSRAVIEVSGPRARDLLAKGCGLDLHPRAFAPGHCAQTLLARLPIILDQLDPTPAYRLFAPASAARWVCDWLLDAAAEFAPPG
jgi:sarcosine oxidase subunit gamma